MNEDKMYIELNNDKLSEFNISQTEATQYLDKLFAEKAMVLDGNGWYVNGRFETVGAVVHILKKTEWFMKSYKKWYWYDGDTGGCEDIGIFYREGVTRYVDST